ncbi:Optic atrophy 3-like protein [Artemisia annua]|uniref:Optic atrophy 3-like protein n=1 Tax=Artemisia annua TaxID=35608 RepID=A0A2U1LUF9_ARTAN|nr:Optic atrophy 3-like protein [Artemisia annua]
MSGAFLGDTSKVADCGGELDYESSSKAVRIAYFSSHFSIFNMLLWAIGAVLVAEAKLETEPQENHRLTITIQRKIYGHATDVEIWPLNEESVFQAFAVSGVVYIERERGRPESLVVVSYMPQTRYCVHRGFKLLQANKYQRKEEKDRAKLLADKPFSKEHNQLLIDFLGLLVITHGEWLVVIASLGFNRLWLEVRCSWQFVLNPNCFTVRVFSFVNDFAVYV